MIPLLRDLREEFLEFYPEELRPMVAAALPELELQAVRLGLEVLHAERSAVSYAEAADRAGDWPLMARVHHGVIDFLQFEIPREVFEILRSVCRSVQSWDRVEDFRRVLFYQASLDRERPDCALARFLLYEAIRLNLWLRAWEEPTVEAVGCLRQCDTEAQSILEEHMLQSAMFDETVRHLNVLVADAVCRLTQQFEKMCNDLRGEAPPIIEFTTGLLLRAVEEARKLNAADAAVLRNEYAPSIGSERLGSALLSERHPHLFSSREAVDMRRSRLPQKLQGSRRVHTRFVDVLRSMHQEAEN